jgi:hypothetical protein
MTKIYGCLDRYFLSYLLTLALRQIQTSRLCFVIPDYTAEELGFSLKSLGRGIAMLELLELLDTGSLLSPQEAFEEDSANIMMSLSM